MGFNKIISKIWMRFKIGIICNSIDISNWSNI